jgi:pimeloyl-ACP methyl ester carboxylesterase
MMIFPDIKEGKRMKSPKLHQLLRPSIGLGLTVCGSLIMAPDVLSRPRACNIRPTGVQATDYMLNFQTENMPDSELDGLDAQIRVHRVRPVYADGECNRVPNLAVVLVHGRSVPGSVSFDLRHPTAEDPEGGTISLQDALARAVKDNFAPYMIGYGLSSRLAVDDRCNASLPAYNADGRCSVVGCDRTRNASVFPLSQQTRYFGDGLLPAGVDGLGVNPGEPMCVHSSPYYFARTDVFARDILRVIDDAIAKAQPRGGKIVLLGSSFGGASTARALYLLGAEAGRKVRRVVFMSSIFNRLPGVPVAVNPPTEEEDLPPLELSTSFPLALNRFGWAGVGPVGGTRDTFCSGRVIPGTPQETAEQLMDLDPLGSSWGGSVPGEPTGLLRSPTFTNYGWNPSVAATFTLPTLVLHGFDDVTSPTPNSNNIFNALTSVSNKVLLQVECGSHQVHQEGCSGNRCDDGDPSTTPYGQDSQVWAGPYETAAAAIVEWVKYGTFDGSECGQFFVNASGIASEVATPNCPAF